MPDRINDETLCAEPDGQITDYQFEVLKSAIRKAWDKYNGLQSMYQMQTGKRYEWLK